MRIRAGISCALAEATEEGHCGLPVEELTALAGSGWLSAAADKMRSAGTFG